MILQVRCLITNYARNPLTSLTSLTTPTTPTTPMTPMTPTALTLTKKSPPRTTRSARPTRSPLPTRRRSLRRRMRWKKERLPTFSSATCRGTLTRNGWAPNSKDLVKFPVCVL